LLRSGSLEDLRAKAVFRKRERMKSVEDALRKGLEGVPGGLLSTDSA
jgi:hypothetical protein